MVEFGLVGTTMHQTDEHVEVEHIRQLAAIYRRILAAYFAGRLRPRLCNRDAPPVSCRR